MKKIKLKALELGAKEILSREQLKNVLGGIDDSGTILDVTCPTACSNGVQGGLCTKGGPYYGGGYTYYTCECDIPGHSSC